MESEISIGLAGFLTAFGAGTLSFLSPCVLPLVPGYLSVVTGASAAEIEDADWRKVIGPSLIFILSFSAIFMAIGVTAVSIGDVFRTNGGTFDKVSGILIIAMGVFFIATLFINSLNREFRFDGLMARAGKGGPMVAGAAFALAWTPCVGPALTAILGLAAVDGSAKSGAILLGVYSAGLALPFLATAVAFTRMTTLFEAVKRNYGLLMGFGGAMLIVIGISILTGYYTEFNIQAQRWLDDLGINVANEL